MPMKRPHRFFLIAGRKYFALRNCPSKLVAIVFRQVGRSSSSSRSPPDDVHALARKRRRPLAVRLARQAAQIESGTMQRPGNRAALIACNSCDENRSIT
jgi:hypothetical protein